MYGNPAVYEAYMGRWSAALAPGFLTFACLDQPNTMLDVGCGTGSLLRAAAERFPRAYLVGVDPVASFLDHARSTLRQSRAHLAVGLAQQLPFADGAFDCCLSLLVLQEFRDRSLALGELHRVTRRGGTVAACQWDFSHGMPMTAALRGALAEIAPEMIERLNSGPARAFTSEGELRQAWETAGLEDVETSRLAATLSYESFDALWQPILGGPTPLTALVASLPQETRDAVRRWMKRRLLERRREGAFAMTAEAFLVRGRASGRQAA